MKARIAMPACDAPAAIRQPCALPAQRVPARAEAAKRLKPRLVPTTRQRVSLQSRRAAR